MDRSSSAVVNFPRVARRCPFWKPRRTMTGQQSSSVHKQAPASLGHVKPRLHGQLFCHFLPTFECVWGPVGCAPITSPPPPLHESILDQPPPPGEALDPLGLDAREAHSLLRWTSDNPEKTGPLVSTFHIERGSPAPPPKVATCTRRMPPVVACGLVALHSRGVGLTSSLTSSSGTFWARVDSQKGDGAPEASQPSTMPHISELPQPQWRRCSGEAPGGWEWLQADADLREV